MGSREKFVERFGEAEAERLEAAAEKHAEWSSGNNRGSDPFKWVLAMTIGFECFTKDAYRTYHGIETPAADLKAWIRDEADLARHDGDADWLSAFVGAYDEYMPKKEVTP